MHAVLVVQPDPSCSPTLLTLYEVTRDEDLGDGWVYGTTVSPPGVRVGFPLSSVRCLAFTTEKRELDALGSRLLELNRQMTGSMDESEHAEQAARTAAERERSELLRLVTDMRRAMATWANDEDGVPEHAADAFDRASRLLGLPESREDC